MTKRSRYIMAAASMILIFSFFFPIWKIDLNAPQYPEGIGLRIWLDKITGLKEHDLQNINGLNHYIGMKPIHPESIPELSIMPFIITALILFGLTAAIVGRKLLVKIWLILFFFLAGAGMVDFYFWGYDYGHNLDPDAPIKVPGMSYQPPLIGSKQLLNIDAVSLPAAGTYFLLISVGLSVYILYRERKTKTVKSQARSFKAVEIFPLLIPALIFYSCSTGPQPIEYGKDSCDNCKMLITDARYAAQIINDKGKAFRFDAIECLGEFIAENYNYNSDKLNLYVRDFFVEETFINVKDAKYIHNDEFRSPMGLNVLATSDDKSIDNFHLKFGGTKMKWEEVLSMISEEL